MIVRWTKAAAADLVRVHEFLAPVNPQAAVATVQSISRAAQRLIETPRIGEKLDHYDPREVRRLIVGSYEMRYEVKIDAAIIILRIWHTRKQR